MTPMNPLRTSILFAGLVVCAAATQAQEATSDHWQQVRSTTPRAAVLAEARRARASGELKFLRAGYVAPVEAPVSRAEVVAQLQRARISGEVQRLNAEAAPFEPSPAAATLIARH